MSFDGFGDDLFWNEHQWEAHLNELENRSEQLRKFITSDPKGNMPRWLTLLRESVDEVDAVDAFIEEELLLDEAYFPDDDDDWEDEDDEEFDDDDLFLEDKEHPFFNEDEDEDDFESGEEWKYLSEDFIFSDYGALENLDIYNSARDMAVDTLRWAESIPVSDHNKSYHEFVSNILKISAKLAGGYSFGFDQDYLGGNIAYNKKALKCSNDALALLQKQKKAPYMSPAPYRAMHARLMELRNDIGIYVQELRDRFNYGIE